MKKKITTSNKLLLGLLIACMIFITVVAGTAKYYTKNMVHQQGEQLLTPPAPPAPPAPPTPPAPPAPGQ